MKSQTIYRFLSILSLEQEVANTRIYLSRINLLVFQVMTPSTYRHPKPSHDPFQVSVSVFRLLDISGYDTFNLQTP
uniref:Uncharacterized protein n=1 Tax=Arundo donax TaxID=35708 RepID=A0A0A8ZH39_ARUDO